MGTAKIKDGIFTRFYYEVRRNKIQGIDDWTPFHPHTNNTFHDMVFVDREEFERGENYTSKNLFEAIIHNNLFEVVHTRRVMTYMDLLGVIGGLRSVLYSVFISIIFKNYILKNLILVDELLINTK